MGLVRYLEGLAPHHRSGTWRLWRRHAEGGLWDEIGQAESAEGALEEARSPLVRLDLGDLLVVRHPGGDLRRLLVQCSGGTVEAWPEGLWASDWLQAWEGGAADARRMIPVAVAAGVGRARSLGALLPLVAEVLWRVFPEGQEGRPAEARLGQLARRALALAAEAQRHPSAVGLARSPTTRSGGPGVEALEAAASAVFREAGAPSTNARELGVPSGPTGSVAGDAALAAAHSAQFAAYYEGLLGLSPSDRALGLTGATRTEARSAVDCALRSLAGGEARAREDRPGFDRAMARLGARWAESVRRAVPLSTLLLARAGAPLPDAVL